MTYIEIQRNRLEAKRETDYVLKKSVAENL